MPSSVALQASGEISIPVPRQFRDYLIAKQHRRYAFGLILYTAIILFFGLVVHWGWHIDIAATLSIIVESVMWRRELKRPWQYKLDKNRMTSIWFELGGRIWRWLSLDWKKCDITTVVETEWRGLPALRVIQQVKYSKWRPDLLIVYAHEDAERVRTQVLPLIEQYRRQYRTPVWADKLRES
jgi:hypothetical protein